MKKALVLTMTIALLTILLGGSVLASNGWYKTLGGIEVYEPVDVTITMYGTPGSSLSAEILENGTPVCDSIITREKGSPHEQSVTLSFEWHMMVTDTGFVNSSYDLILMLETNRPGSGNPVTITLDSEWWGTPQDISLIFKKGDNGMTETISIDNLLADLFEDLYDEYNGQIRANTGQQIFLAPGDPPDEEYIIDWESFYWDFGDGTTLDTTELMVSHTYTDPGTYTILLVTTYEDDSTATVSMEVVVT